MPRFAANLSLMFTELPWLERPAAARAAGFRAVECQSPYDLEARDLAAAVREADLAFVLINAPAGNWAAGEQGLAALPGREADFRIAFEQALDTAATLSCPRVHCMAGCPSAGFTRNELEAVYQANLRHAARKAEAAGVTVMIEPINTFDRPGYLLATCAQARNTIEQLGVANLRLQFDCYHARLMEPDLLAALRRHADLIDHLQISGFPGRHEPDDRQDIDYPALFVEFDRFLPEIWVGCEYQPRSDTWSGLGWAKAYGISGRTLTC